MDVVVTGGGPSGMMAAARAAERGCRVTLLEKNPSLGKKLLLTGGGRCNFTNAEPDNQRLAAFYGKKGRYLLSPFSRFSSQDALNFFKSRGMGYKVEDRNRAFPASDSSEAVLRVLREYLEETRVRVVTHCEVTSLKASLGQIVRVETRKGCFEAEHLILATGGTSLPATGSTGDGYRWLAELGHRVRIPEPSLVPLAVRESWIKDLAGLAFPQVRLQAWGPSGQLASDSGKLLLTHFGLSGPLVLNLATTLQSAHRELAASGNSLELRLDFFPSVDAGQLDRDLLENFRQGPNRLTKTALAGLLPPRLVSRVLILAGLDGETPLYRLTKAERRRVVEVLKAFPLTFEKLMDASRAVVTSGGVSLDEVDFKTMKSRIIPNLSIVGDLLDFERPTGGFSLQICWATAWSAGSAFEPSQNVESS
ncbi:MAG: NAD(P)/FAD-dependent oxidoreductase [Spirochaetales bacterium]|nr:NAD(P)/FAD-dependent oxidoreductase [Spirochaetales bacterium]